MVLEILDFVLVYQEVPARKLQCHQGSVLLICITPVVLCYFYTCIIRVKHSWP